MELEYFFQTITNFPVLEKRFRTFPIIRKCKKSRNRIGFLPSQIAHLFGLFPFCVPSHFLSFIGFPHVSNIVLPRLNLRMLIIPFPYMVCRFVYPLDLFRRQMKHLLIEPVHLLLIQNLLSLTDNQKLYFFLLQE